MKNTKNSINNDFIYTVDDEFYDKDWMTRRYEVRKNWGTSFWDTDVNDVDLITGKSRVVSDQTYRLIKLSKYLKAISNFVKIMTGRDDISVRFASNDQSYTNGKSIVVSSDISDGNFDTNVGLALHESSHILKSDMNFFNTLKQFVVNSKDVIQKLMIKYNEKDQSKIENFIFERLKDLTNIIEDRRVDDFVYKTSPGYMIYYHALYEKYFMNDIITKALSSDSLRDENWKSYNFRVNYLTNPITLKTLDSLKNLKKIYDLIDISNISRLKNVQDSFNLALEIFTIIENSVNPIKNQIEQKKKSDDGSDSSQKCDNKSNQSEYEKSKSSKNVSNKENNENKKDNNSKSDEKSDNSKSDEKGDNSKSNEKGDNGETPKSLEDSLDDIDYSPERYGNLSEKELTVEIDPNDLDKNIDSDELKKMMSEIKSFIDNTVEKKKLNNDDLKDMKALEQANVVIRGVGENKSIECILVKSLTMDLINSNKFNNILTREPYMVSENEKSIKLGIQRGTVLGKQLKIRTEKRELKHTRLEHGKIDRHILHELGYRDNNVFYKTTIDKFNDIYIHISVDASSSMNGSKWYKTMETIVSIAKATSMITGIHLVISFRNTTNDSTYSSKPFIIIAYDNKVDGFKKIETLFKHLKPSGTTPEGLTFEAIMSEFPTFTVDTNKFFLNFSDGMPYFHSFSDEGGIEITRKQVKKLMDNDIEVISYYISDSYGFDGSISDFRRMYGRGAENIDLSNMTLVANTLNKRFLTK